MKCIGATCGDCIGFPMEFIQSHKFINYQPFSMGCHFTDDTVMTIATMAWLLSGELTHESKVKYIVEYGLKYKVGYGPMFRKWLLGLTHYEPYNSYGNGSGMAASPIGWFFNNEEDVLKYAKISAEVTHNHPEGIKDAQAIAIAVFLARTGHSKEDIKKYIENKVGYDLNRTIDEIRPEYKFEVSCQKSVPESIICFLEANSTLEAIQLAISLGGDSDTMANMAGAIAEAYYNDCDDLFNQVINFKDIDGEYPKEFVDIINEFNNRI